MFSTDAVPSLWCPCSGYHVRLSISSQALHLMLHLPLFDPLSKIVVRVSLWKIPQLTRRHSRSPSLWCAGMLPHWVTTWCHILFLRFMATCPTVLCAYWFMHVQLSTQDTQALVCLCVVLKPHEDTVTVNRHLPSVLHQLSPADNTPHFSPDARMLLHKQGGH